MLAHTKRTKLFKMKKRQCVAHSLRNTFTPSTHLRKPLKIFGMLLKINVFFKNGHCSSDMACSSHKNIGVYQSQLYTVTLIKITSQLFALIIYIAVKNRSLISCRCEILKIVFLHASHSVSHGSYNIASVSL